jgi:hypothetical protein
LKHVNDKYSVCNCETLSLRDRSTGFALAVTTLAGRTK